jgi:hypothetical protein
MKLIIFYENLTMTTELKETIILKDIISSAMKSLKIQEMQNLRVLNEAQKFMDLTSKIEAKKDERRLYLITIPTFKRRVSSVTTPLDELIPEVTGGKTKLRKSEKVKNDPMDRLTIIEQMLNQQLPNLNNTANVQGGSLNNRMVEITMIQDMLRGMISGRDMTNINNTVSIPGSVSNNNNIIPNENHINSLKEMGFPEDRSRRALIMARNNLSRATDLLLNDALDYEQPQK